MNHAKEHTHNRKNKTSEKQATAKASRTTTYFFKINDKDKRSAGDPAGSKPKRTSEYVADAFLKCRFLPKLQESESIEDGEEGKKMERDFYKSLSYLKAHYNIVQHDYRSLGFPYNVALTMSDLAKQYQNVANFEDLKIVQEKNEFFLVNEEKLDQNGVLYYIPVIPLYLWMRTKERKKGAILLLSVFSYLYHGAKIPFYRDDDSFLYGEYEMLQEWLMDDEDEDHHNRLSDFKKAEVIGDIIGQKFYNLKNLDMFGQRIEHFKCRNPWDKKVLSIAKEALTIYEKYPNATLLKNTELTNVFEEEEEENFHDTMYIENYVCFSADGNGWLLDTLVQCVNDQFQEYSKIEEPTVKNSFDKADKDYGNLDYEIRLFKLLDKLVSLLLNT